MFNIFKKKQKTNQKIQETMENIVSNLAAINNKNQSMIMNSKQSSGFKNNNFYDVEAKESPKNITRTNYEPSKEEVIIEVESNPIESYRQTQSAVKNRLLARYYPQRYSSFVTPELGAALWRM